MKRKPLMIAAGAFVVLLFLLYAVLWFVAGTSAIVSRVGQLVSEEGSSLLGSRIEVKGVRVESLYSLTMNGIEIYDKKDELVMKAESADVRLNPLRAFADKPAGAVREVVLRHPEAYLKLRADGTWNYEDFIEEESEPSGFSGIVRGEDGTLDVAAKGQTLRLQSLRGSADFADEKAIRAEAEGKAEHGSFAAKGTVGDAAAHFSVEAESARLEDYVGWLPEGLLPSSVEVRGGLLEHLSAEGEKHGETVSCRGKARLSEGRVRVLDTEVTAIAGTADFTEGGVTLDAVAEAEGQKASAHGFIDFSGKEPELSLVAQSDAFDPGAVLKESPFHGAVAFTASVTGTPAFPIVDGVFRATEGELSGHPFKNASASASYVDGRISAQSLAADIFGGHIDAEGEFDAQLMAFDGHALVNEIDAATLAEYVPEVAGRVSADLGFAGRLDSIEDLSVYGSVSAHDIAYREVHAPQLNASFFREEGQLVIDFASLRLDNDGSLGVEGRVTKDSRLDLAVYGSRVDLSILSQLEPMLEVSGFADFAGTVKGGADNPMVEAEISASEGKLLMQPYRTLRSKVGGSLDGLRVDSFSMENGGKETWLAKGTVGLTGERRIDLRIDTVGARLEDIAALVAPDQPITGDIDNVIMISGTLDRPSAVGYVSSHRGSYKGYLLSGMEGDYTLADGILTLQDFHIFSPRVDMDLNGTVAIDTRAMDLRVAVHDIDLKRFDKELPYDVEGHGVFNGHITGSFGAPAFDGKLVADTLSLNGAKITDAVGEVRLRGSRLELAPFSFRQGGGLYSLRASLELQSERMQGQVKVENGDLGGLLTIADAKNDAVRGRVNMDIGLGGTLSEPRLTASGHLTEAAVRDYPLTDVFLDAILDNRVLTIRRAEGHQADGVLSASGVIDFDGPVDARFTAQNIRAGLIAAATGSDLKAVGTLNVDAEFGGTVQNPSADASLTMLNGGVVGSSFDALNGLFHLRDGVVEIEKLLVEKAKGEKTYRASALGTLPLKAFMTDSGEAVTDADRLNLALSLDEADLGLLPVLSDAIEWSMGETTGNVTVGGTLAAPTFNGAFRIKDGTVKLKALQIPVTDLNFGLRMDGNRFAVEEGSSGKIGKGAFRLEGSMRLDGRKPTDYRLAFDANQLEIASKVFTGPLTASLKLDEGKLYKWQLPRLSGQVSVDDVLISVPSIPESDSELPNVMLDLGIDIGKHTHLYSSGLYNLWIQGAVRFGGTTHHPKQSGSITVRRGKVQYLQTSFRITEGEAYFNQVDSFLPSITFKAMARMNRARIFLGIDGPLQQMNFKLTSSPEMSQEEILRTLTFRGASASRGASESEAQKNALLLAGLQMSVLGDVQEAIRGFLKLDEFNLSTGSFRTGQKRGDKERLEAYNIEMGKYIGDKVMLHYTQGIDADLRRYGIRYDFTDRFGMFVGRDERNHDWVGFSARLNF